MKDFRQFEEYHANEKDIANILNFLRIFHPDRATRQEAINFLEYLGTVAYEKVSGATDKDMQQLYTEYSKSTTKE
jgi:hypothetical protein